MATHARKIFVNLPVRDLKRSMAFYSALGAGGSRAMDPQDHGFMSGWSFIDPDGHHWEPTWMDPAAIQPVPEQGGQR